MTGPYAGMSAEQRSAERQRVADRNAIRAAAVAAKVGRSLACGTYGRHDLCPGAADCLCDCHDEVVS